MSATPWIVGGAVVVAGGFGFWLYHRQAVAAAAAAGAAAAPAAPHAAGSRPFGKINSLVDALAGLGGAGTGAAFGVPDVGGVFSKAGTSIVGGQVRAFEDAGRGVLSIAHGNVLGGGKQVLTSAAQSAYAATGTKAVVSVAAKPVKAVGNFVAHLF